MCPRAGDVQPWPCQMATSLGLTASAGFLCILFVFKRKEAHTCHAAALGEHPTGAVRSGKGTCLLKKASAAFQHV